MLYLSSLLSVAFAAQAAFATPLKARTAYEVKEIHQAPRKWSSKGRAPSDHMLHMQIGLKQHKFDELERHLYEGKIHEPNRSNLLNEAPLNWSRINTTISL